MEDWGGDLSPCNFATTHSPAERSSFISPCNFATTHLTACILNVYLPFSSRPMKRRTLSQRPSFSRSRDLALILGFIYLSPPPLSLLLQINRLQRHTLELLKPVLRLRLTHRRLNLRLQARGESSALNQRALSGGLDPWGVGSANLGRSIFASNFPQTPLKQAFPRNWGQKWGAPNLQIQRPTDPTPH